MISTSRRTLPLAIALALTGCQTPSTAPLGQAAGTAGTYALSAAQATASASVTNGSFVAARAIDGNTDTEWQSGYRSNPTLTIDWGAVGSYRAIALKAKPNVGSFTVSVSTDGQSYAPALTNAKTSSWSMESKTLASPLTARYVRFQFANGGQNVMLFEVSPPEALPSAAPSSDPVPGGAIASTTNGSYVAARAVDGNTDTEWQSNGTPSTLTIDRHMTGALTSLAIKTNPNVPYDVEISEDGQTFKPLLTNQKHSSWNLETKSVPSGASGRYLRLKFNTATKAMVFEVKTTGGTLVAPSAAPSTAPTAAPSTAPSVLPTLAPSTAPAGGLMTRFGNQSVPRIGTGPYTQGYGLVREMGLTTIREGFNWKNLEPTRGQLVSWMPLVDSKVDELNKMGVKIQAMITDTPDWASSDSRYSSKTGWDPNSPGKYTLPAGLDQPAFADGTDQYKPGLAANAANPFASYLHRLATRYKGKIAYYQIWNEPDFPSGDLGRGEKAANGWNRYFTGSVQDYARMLRVARAVVTGIDPQAKITTGGLGYPGYLDALVSAGAAQDFDMLDFHAYGTDKTSANGVLNSDWGFLGRYKALKGVLTARGVTGKTYGVSETGMTADNPTEQAGYVTKVIATARALGDVETVQWAVFTNPGHLNIGVVDGATLTKKTTGYWATAFASAQFANATYLGAVGEGGWTGYRFRKPDGQTFGVAWADAGSVSATWPQGVKQLLGSTGQAQAASGSRLALGTAPVYVVE